MADKVIVKDYNILFDPVVYLQTFYGDLSTWDDMMYVLYGGFHKAFMHGDLHGTRLLDIGTGPSICSVTSAVPYVEEIYLSDLSEANRDSLRRWQNGSPDHNFQPFIEYFLKLEKKELLWSVREEELKRKIKDILRCDVLQSQIVTDGDIGPVDIITSSLCLEAAATDIACYEKICKKIGAMLNDGGHLVLVGVLEQTFYVHNGHNFYTLFLTKEDMIRAWKNAGFSVVTWEEKKAPPEENPFSDFGAGFVLVARKVKE